MSNPGPASTVQNPSSNLAMNQAIRLLGVYQAVNLNATGDTIIPILGSPAAYSVSNVIVANASVSLTTAAAGVFPLAGGGGTAIVSNAALSGLTGSTIVSQRTINSTARQTGANVYFRVATAQGAAATADVYVYGYDLTIN